MVMIEMLILSIIVLVLCFIMGIKIETPMASEMKPKTPCNCHKKNKAPCFTCADEWADKLTGKE